MDVKRGEVVLTNRQQVKWMNFTCFLQAKIVGFGGVVNCSEGCS